MTTLAIIRREWPLIVGPMLASVTTPRLWDSTDQLTIVAHPSWVRELVALERLLVSSINETLGYSALRRIKVVRA